MENLEYKIGNKIFDYNSCKNQDVRKRFTKFEIKADVSSVIEFCIGSDDPTSPISINDCIPGEVAKCPYCGQPLKDEDIHIVGEPDIDGLVTPIEDVNPEEGCDNTFVCYLCGNVYDTFEEARECCMGEEVFLCKTCDEVFPIDEATKEFDSDPTAWYVVTKWLGEQLADIGELVLETYEGEFVWGACNAGGDEIYNSNPIRIICDKVKIHEGQENYKEIK